MTLYDREKLAYNLVRRVSIAEAVEVLQQMERSHAELVSTWSCVVPPAPPRDPFATFRAEVQRPDIEVWFFDGPWGFLSGAAGYCVVERGVVTANLPTEMS